MTEQGFGEFYQQTAPALRNYVARVLGSTTQADDIVQEAYLRMLRYPPAIEDPRELRAYLFRVAGNLIVDGWRRQQRQAAAMQPAVIPAANPDAALRLDMERLFRELRPRDRQLMWLAYVEGASHREIAAALRLRERSIRVLLSRARKHFARLLGASLHGAGEQS